ncbi:pyridoxamine 5'-phosphate oxidase family protein [Nocardia blacklockiae]|uniref:pyridoxamine 5'-phosphate oxidase family protein n=1 Tax=Nocardia blacklockiae TaxID=480036 RepID=UPI001893A799|nr:pyridoxamine 5'-phosphate oxidase family protein [Nocardia blacklockiae]MBF6170856.1 pyridoxamine 5'-phosphate oxidase family protein [Nocardia blacklockiae]
MALTARDREQFLSEPHIGALAVAAAPGRGPLTVPIWYDYVPGGELWVLTGPTSKKLELIEAAGRFSLMVDRVEPTVRYVTVEGPVTRVVPAADAVHEAMVRRYLPPDKVAGYLKFAETLGPQSAVYMRPRHWLSADMGDLDDF